MDQYNNPLCTEIVVLVCHDQTVSISCLATLNCIRQYATELTSIEQNGVMYVKLKAELADKSNVIYKFTFISATTSSELVNINRVHGRIDVAMVAFSKSSTDSFTSAACYWMPLVLQCFKSIPIIVGGICCSRDRYVVKDCVIISQLIAKYTDLIYTDLNLNATAMEFFSIVLKRILKIPNFVKFIPS